MNSLLRYFKNHWLGQLPVSKALLLNFILPLGIAWTALPSVVESIFALGSYYRLVVALFLCACFLVFFSWQCFGLLRTGDIKTTETGERLWSTGFQVLIVLSILFVIVLAVGVFQQITALKKAELEKEFEFARSYKFIVKENGGVVEVIGDLDPGVTRELGELLKVEKKVHTVELNSGGGQIYEGRGLHQLFKQSELNTLVTHHCLSACSTAYLGGVERRIGVGGEIGFHQYKTYSIQPNIDVETEQSRDKELMRSQGVSADFVSRVFSASPSEMWVPSHDELISSKVVNAKLE